MRLLKFYWVPIVVLVLSLGATGLAAYSVALTSRARDQARFWTATSSTRNVIEERLNIYTSGLRSGAGLFAAQEQVTLSQFRAYVERLRFQEIYPGIQGFGFARRTLPEERAPLLQRLREQGQIDFQITPPGDRAEYFPIIYLEPLDERNRRAIGYDMFSEPVRHEAMARARDEGEAAASGKVTLVQEIDLVHRQPGFLVYVPVYRGGKIPGTTEERRANLLGFIYSPFRADDFFVAMFPSLPEEREVHFAVYDGAGVHEEALLHNSRVQFVPDSPFLEVTQLTFAGHRWTLVFRPSPLFMAASSQGLVPWVFGIGLLISLTLCGITVALARTHRDLHLAQVQLKEHAQNLEKAVAARTARLRETVAELERMSYSIVHDLRAPLRAIQSFAGILEEEAGTTLTADCRGYLARMKTAASRMDALIRDVLNYGKLVKEELPLTPIDLNRLLSGILETYPAFQKDSADITLAPDLPVVLANEAALTQCFSNLLDNAVKFVKPGQKPRVHVSAEPPPLHHSITPSLHHSPLPAQPQGRFVRICVADQGIGIPPELHSKVFGMFERLDTSHEGTGMGLTIVRKATERMGGKVSLFSEPGHGTRVCIDLRLVD